MGLDMLTYKMDSNDNPSGIISHFYDGKCIFMTGVTFMGKVLLHKLLDSCPTLESIYVLIRPKRDVLPHVRLDKLYDGPLFKNLKETNASSFKKVFAIAGDITLPRLGMSNDDFDMVIEKTSVVFHSAATVRFDEELRKSVAMNVEGTRSIIELAQKMQKLKALIHVSTAYAHCTHHSKIEEKFYCNNNNPDDIIEKCQNEEMDEDTKQKLIGEHPNTYVFTKALAEQLLLDKGQSLPLAIIRPSIVVASWKYPMKGWVDNLNGPTGAMAGIATGVLRTMHVEKDFVADLIPVDVVINAMIVAAWKTAQDYNGNPTIPSVYNVTSSSIKPITWGQVHQAQTSSVNKYPMSTMLWSPGCTLTRYTFHDRLNRWLFHYAPALIIDGVQMVLRRPTFMRKLINRMTEAIEAINFFCLHQWSWTNTNLNNLQSALVNTDNESLESFSFDIRSLDWKIFMDHNVLGLRHYVLKNHPDSMESSRKKLNILYFLHLIIQLAFVFFLIYNLMNVYSTWDVSKDIDLPVPGFPTLSNNFMARIWNTIPGLQHATTLGAAK